MHDRKRFRIDRFLVEEGFFNSRQKAIESLKSGEVFVNGQPIYKPSHPIRGKEVIFLTEPGNPWVSRGGLKLKEAFNIWNLKVDGLICMDVGASTGGFTDVLLYYSAQKVYAVDVGKDQLSKRIKNDPRVVCIERTDFRNLDDKNIKESIGFISIDVSYISLTLILKKAGSILDKGGAIIALIKPQFELGESGGLKKGVVKREKEQKAAIARVASFAEDVGLVVCGITPSPLLGRKGNREFLIHLKKP